MGLTHVKSAIAPALDADSPSSTRTANGRWSARTVASSAGNSIYEGWRFRGRVVHTMGRGSVQAPGAA
jgi:dihydropyrimidinase